MDNDYLIVTASFLEDKKYAGHARENSLVEIDCLPPYGAGDGYSDLELLLISFSSSVCLSLSEFLKNQRKKDVKSVNAQAKGYVRDEDPKVISRIELELFIASPDTEGLELGEALKALEDRLCPVWVMLKAAGARITVLFELSR